MLCIYDKMSVFFFGTALDNEISSRAIIAGKPKIVKF